MVDKNKLLATRDVIMFFLGKSELDADECKQVLQMCNDEVDAAVRRMSITEVKRDGDDSGKDCD
ncbi:MAG: hypothetical protein E7406_01655 [Ruminococcaceae bacterium]|nr:hypothetical protein [Oscillospiraceae bacterium]